MNTQRLERGLDLEQAFEHWSDPAVFSQLVEACGESPPVSVEGFHRLRRTQQDAAAYTRLRETAEKSFMDKLQKGLILCSAIADGGQRREIIEPSFWDVLELNFDFDEFGWKSQRYSTPEFFDLNRIPANVRTRPAWLEEALAAAGHSAFRHDPDYTVLFIEGIKFELSQLQSRAIRILHQAVLGNEPWQFGKEVAEEAGSAQSTLSELFRDREDWELLIDSRRDGRYRFRVDQDGHALWDDNERSAARKKS